MPNFSELGIMSPELTPGTHPGGGSNLLLCPIIGRPPRIHSDRSTAVIAEQMLRRCLLQSFFGRVW